MKAKQRFMKMPEAKAFPDIVLGDACQTALDYALLELQERLQLVPDGHAHLKGALLFREILQEIAIPDEEPKALKTPTLNHDAYNRPTRSR